MQPASSSDPDKKYMCPCIQNNTDEEATAAAMANSLPPELLLAARSGDWRKLGEMDIGVDVDVEEAKANVNDSDAAHYGPSSDSVLHVVASAASWWWCRGGFGEESPLKSTATVIFGRAKHLLGARNASGDTPLHCAARAGSTEMVSHLISLARFERRGAGAGVPMLPAVLRKANRRGETVLHDAVRLGDEEMVEVLLAEDAELARFPRDGGGVSPLYLAILLGHDDIAVQLYEKDKELSYSGPDGQNALHVAVVRSKGMTEKLLKWNDSLIKQGDRSSGSTPLHFLAASSKGRTSRSTSQSVAKLLLDAYEASAYQSDAKGSFPIHVAASSNNGVVVEALLSRCPGCAQLQDGEGRTLLHLAALNGHHGLAAWAMDALRGGDDPSDSDDARAAQSFAAMVNMPNDQGNTALHYAVGSKSYRTVYPFIRRVEVQLNLQNYEGQTALDLARMARPPGILFQLDPEVRVLNLLMAAGARPGLRARGGEDDDDGKPNEHKKATAERIKDCTATIAIVSVLILTISFAAAFQLPGGYDKLLPSGTPALFRAYSFEAFVVANNLAAFCAAVSAFTVVIAGVVAGAGDGGGSLRARRTTFAASVFFLNSAARSLAAAFAFGTYAVMAPVARAAAALTWTLASFLVAADIAWVIWMKFQDQWALLNRRGKFAVCFRLVVFAVGTSLLPLWPYVVIAAFVGSIKAHGIH